MTAAEKPRPLKLHELPSVEAHALRREGIGSPNAAQRFARDPGARAFERIVDFGEYLAEFKEVPGTSRAFVAELERKARILERRLQRALLARDNGGVCPANHPALPVNPLFQGFADGE